MVQRLTHWWKNLSGFVRIILALSGIFLIWLAGQLFGLFFQESYVFANNIWEPFRLLREWDPNKITKQEFIKPVAIIRFIIMLFIWLCVVFSPVLLFLFLNNQRRLDTPQYSNPTVVDIEDQIKHLVFVLEDNSSTQRAKDLQLHAVFDSVVKFVIDFYGQSSESVRATVIIDNNGTPLLTDFKWGWRATSFQEANDLQMVTQLNTAPTDNNFWTQVKDAYPDADKNTALLIRNIGTYKLGVFFSFKSEISYDGMLGRTQLLSKAILPFALLGLIDSIQNHMIQYTLGGGQNAG